MKRALTLTALAILCMSSVAVPAQAMPMFARPAIQATIQNNFAVRQQQLRSEIAKDVNTGTISPMTAANLTSQLDQINYQEQQDLAATGMITDAQNESLIAQFSNVTSQLTSFESAAFAGAPCAPVCAVAVPAVVAPVPVAVNAPAPFFRPAPAFGRFQPAPRKMMARVQPAPRPMIAHNVEARPAFAPNRGAAVHDMRHRG